MNPVLPYVPSSFAYAGVGRPEVLRLAVSDVSAASSPRLAVLRPS